MSAFRDAWRDEFLAAFTFLTRLPLGSAQTDALRPSLADASWAFPLVGLVIGAIGGIAYAIASALALPALAAALIAVATTALITGALHEDGLADTADGFGGGATRESKLDIMRDSRIGTFGVLALIFSIGLRVVAIADVGTRWHVFAALIAANALSRGVLPAAMHRLDPARADGLGAGAGRPEQNQVLIALAIALVAAVIATGLRAGSDRRHRRGDRRGRDRLARAAPDRRPDRRCTGRHRAGRRDRGVARRGGLGMSPARS